MDGNPSMSNTKVFATHFARAECPYLSDPDDDATDVATATDSIAKGEGLAEQGKKLIVDEKLAVGLLPIEDGVSVERKRKRSDVVEAHEWDPEGAYDGAFVGDTADLDDSRDEDYMPVDGRTAKMKYNQSASKVKEQLKMPKGSRHKSALRQSGATNTDTDALQGSLPKPVEMSEDVPAIQQSLNLIPEVCTD
ncbi:hypothetical protein JG687_00016210 [Phytophthora cactorum]|uniref:Uncharacterized protein n=1 Tax=Phytophthora cactorum TaxID=29920 RepID=A0A8T1TWL6_9STRA|nr:hypothetical protein JG687_00016210 [Phytophthora cactorum]